MGAGHHGGYPHHACADAQEGPQNIYSAGWLISSSTSRTGFTTRRTWTWSHQAMASWTFLLPRPRVAILGMMKRKIPLFSIHPAIPTLVQKVPSVGPGDRYTAESVPMDQTSSHTVASVSSTHVSVGRVTAAGVHTTEDSVEINPVIRGRPYRDKYTFMQQPHSSAPQ